MSLFVLLLQVFYIMRSQFVNELSEAKFCCLDLIGQLVHQDKDMRKGHQGEGG